MNPLLLLGAGIVALIVAKKPATATPAAPTANGGAMPLSPSNLTAALPPGASPGCNPPPANATAGPRIYRVWNTGGDAVPMRMGVGGSFMTPDGRYYIGPQFAAIEASIGGKPNPCAIFYEGPYTQAQMAAKGYTT